VKANRPFSLPFLKGRVGDGLIEFHLKYKNEFLTILLKTHF
jgi:hypothetical protein